jgi:hypothetical protein
VDGGFQVHYSLPAGADPAPYGAQAPVNSWLVGGRPPVAVLPPRTLQQQRQLQQSLQQQQQQQQQHQQDRPYRLVNVQRYRVIPGVQGGQDSPYVFLYRTADPVRLYRVLDTAVTRRRRLL